jgi:hypothetical protein
MSISLHDLRRFAIALAGLMSGAATAFLLA